MHNGTLVLAAAAILGLLVVGTCSRRQAAESAAVAVAEAAAEQKRLVDAQRRPGTGVSPDADGSASSAAQIEIHQCIYAGQTSSQLGPCRAPWVEVKAPEPGPESEQSSTPAAVPAAPTARELAEQRLRAEQDKFAALTTQPGQPAPVGPAAPAIPASAYMSRCAQAKAARDAAYLKWGNSRNFNVTRQWNDVVYEACKSP